MSLSLYDSMYSVGKSLKKQDVNDAEIIINLRNS